jgi:hypothetical protein
MSSRNKAGPKEVKVTRTPYGYSILIDDPNPETRYLPVDPKRAARAVREADAEFARKTNAAA